MAQSRDTARAEDARWTPHARGRLDGEPADLYVERQDTQAGGETIPVFVIRLRLPDINGGTLLGTVALGRDDARKLADSITAVL